MNYVTTHDAVHNNTPYFSWNGQRGVGFTDPWPLLQPDPKTGLYPGPESNLLSHWYEDYSVAHERCVKPVHEDVFGDPGELQCCGEHPNRFPYRTNRKQCCNGNIVGLGEC